MHSSLPKAARQLIKDETFGAALETVLSSLKDELFNTQDPEGRERVFQEHQGLMRVRQRLGEWASHEALKKEEK